jgi:hypothetical protein
MSNGENMGGSWEPACIHWWNGTAFCWRTPEGWRYHCAGPGGINDTLEPPTEAITPADSGIYETREDAIEAMAFSLAQITFRADDGWEAPPFLKDAQRRRMFASWAWWQILYGRAIDAGLAHHAARRYADSAKEPGVAPAAAL